MRTRKIWSRGPRHAHVGGCHDGGIADTQNLRKEDRDTCLFHPDCFSKAARAGDDRVCKDDCARFVEERR